MNYCKIGSYKPALYNPLIIVASDTWALSIQSSRSLASPITLLLHSLFLKVYYFLLPRSPGYLIETLKDFINWIFFFNF